MPPLTAALHKAADLGKPLLVCGLIAAVAFPSLALAMKPALPFLVSLLLFLSALRIGHRSLLAAMHEVRSSVLLVLIFQLALPVLLGLVVIAAGWQHQTLSTALILMLAAPPILGGPSIALMIGRSPVQALHLLLIGTTLLPLTVVPIFVLLPDLGTVEEVVGASLRLLGVILVAAGGGFALRAWAWPAPMATGFKSLDGLTALTMAVLVVGLMSAVRPALDASPVGFLFWLGTAFAANIGIQLVSSSVLRRTPLARHRVSYSIMAGNRNMGIFLAALPPGITDPVLLFIGCYQIPMYLMPILARWLYGPDPERS